MLVKCNAGNQWSYFWNQRGENQSFLNSMFIHNGRPSAAESSVNRWIKHRLYGVEYFEKSAVLLEVELYSSWSYHPSVQRNHQWRTVKCQLISECSLSHPNQKKPSKACLLLLVKTSRQILKLFWQINASVYYVIKCSSQSEKSYNFLCGNSDSRKIASLLRQWEKMHENMSSALLKFQ